MKPLALICITFLLGSPPASYGEVWTTQEVVEEGVVHILNTRVGREAPKTLELDHVWTVGTGHDDGPIFGLVRHLIEDSAGTSFILDYQLSEISVFSPSGEFIRKIGRLGQGPGDLLRPDGICISPTGEVWVSMAYPSRIARFSPDGSSIGTIVLPEDATGVVPIVISTSRAGNQVIAHATQGEDSFICALNERGDRTTVYYKERHAADGPDPVYEERSRALRGRWAATNDRVYVASSFDDYQINVYKLDGTLDRVIHREYESRKRSKSEKEAVYNWANINPAAVLPGTKFEIEDYDKDIMAVHARNDGTCWVLSSRGAYDRPKGTAGVFDVYDNRGRLVRQVALVGDGDPVRDRYHFAGDHLYVVKCYADAVARLVGSDSDPSQGCEDAMSIACYRLP